MTLKAMNNEVNEHIIEKIILTKFNHVWKVDWYFRVLHLLITGKGIQLETNRKNEQKTVENVVQVLFSFWFKTKVRFYDWHVSRKCNNI